MMSRTAMAPGVRPASRLKLLLIANDAVNFGHGGELLRLGLRRATGDDDARLRPLALHAADRLPRLAHGFAGHRANIGVSPPRAIVRTGRRPMATTSRVMTSYFFLSRAQCSAISRCAADPGLSVPSSVAIPDLHRCALRASACAAPRSGTKKTHATPPFLTTAPDRTCLRIRIPRRRSSAHDRRPLLSASRSSDPLARQRHFHLALGALWWRAAATAVAQAAEPHALVSPAPRSQVRMTMCSRVAICANVMLARSGKIGWFSSKRPKFWGDRRALTSSTQKIACGLPMFTNLKGECKQRSVDRSGFATRSCGCRGIPRPAGFSFHLKRGGPMSTVKFPSAPFQQLRMPAVVSNVSASLPASLPRQPGDAAHAIKAAGAGFRAVIVVDAHKSVGAGTPAADKAPSADRKALLPPAFGWFSRAVSAAPIGLPPLAAHIDNDNLIADAVHLDE